MREGRPLLGTFWLGVKADWVAGLLPRDHAARQLKDVGVALLDQNLHRFRAHPPASAVQDDLGASVDRQLVELTGDLVVRDRNISLGNAALERDVDVDEGEVLVPQHRLEFDRGDIGIRSPLRVNLRTDALTRLSRDYWAGGCGWRARGQKNCSKQRN